MGSTASTSLGDAVGALTTGLVTGLTTELVTGLVTLVLPWLERVFILVELTIQLFWRVLDDGGCGGVGIRARHFERVTIGDDC